MLKTTKIDKINAHKLLMTLLYTSFKLISLVRSKPEFGHIACGMPPRVIITNLGWNIWLKFIKKRTSNTSTLLRKVCNKLTLNCIRSQLNGNFERHRQPSLKNILFHLQKELVPLNVRIVWTLIFIFTSRILNRNFSHRTSYCIPIACFPHLNNLH